MTTNQIAYWKNQEEIRANKEKEKISQEANRIKQLEADIKASELQEKTRHNKEEEYARSRELLQQHLHQGSQDWSAGVKNAIEVVKTAIGYF